MTPRQIERRARARRNLGCKLRRTAVVVGVGVSALAVAGVAEAYFTSTGGGAATVTTQTVSNLTAVATTTTPLYPGIAGADVTVKVTNPNTLPVTVTAISAGTITGCTTPAVTFVAKPADLGFVVGAGLTSTVVLHQALAMGTAASSNCQGASISVPLSLSGKTS